MGEIISTSVLLILVMQLNKAQQTMLSIVKNYPFFQGKNVKISKF